MFLRAIKLVLKEGTTLDLYFNDGTVKRYDMILLEEKYPVFSKLRDRNFFLKGKLLDWGGVIWDDETDIAMEHIHDYGEDVSSQYNDIDQVVFGESVNYKRISLDLTQEELAKKIGIDQSDLSKIEKGISNPSIKMMSRIAKGLGCSIDYSKLLK